MESARLQRKRTNSEPVVGNAQRGRVIVTSFPRQPLTFNDAHSPALRLGHVFGPSHTPVPHALQANLTVNEPGDQYEQEADRVAEQVMRMPDPALRLQRKCGCGGSAASGESCAQCSQEQSRVQRRATARSS